jgi:hypothetical protein
MSRTSSALVALICVVALSAGSMSRASSGAAESSCSRGPQAGGVAATPTPLQEPFLPLIREEVAAHGDISTVYAADDGTIHIGLHPEVTQADLCVVADLVFEKFGLPVEVAEKRVVAVSG